ncbi:MAG: Ribosomal RNA small subunit methyltransferase A [Candidatus Anoxychlamydiales bacterium]|nr:Ribosomal RNA small subunit methyltransferase A [Candidatus Anoxychlamydiales bacterium]
MLHKPTDLIQFLNENNIRPKKALSQNFLIDQNIVKKFVNALDINEDDIVLEIGPGPGVLTFEVLKKAKEVIVIEKDTFYANNLKKQNILNLKVFEDDFLTFDFNKIKKNKKIKVISSLPYSITAPIISKLLKNNLLFSKIVIMLQKEVANRICSKKDLKTYSSFTIFVNYFSKPSIIHNVSKNCFFPAPKVDSTILSLEPKNLKKPLDDDFFNFVRLSFNQRRKKITSSLKNHVNKQNLISALKELNLDLNARAENLSLENYINLYKYLY